MSAKSRSRSSAVGFLVYLAVRALAAAVCMLSPRAVERFGRLAGRLLCAVHGRRRVAMEQIAAAEGMPNDPRQTARIVRGMYESIALGFAENFIVPQLIRRGEFQRRTRLENFGVLERALAHGRGAILLLGHQINWEWIGVAIAQAGYALNSVARPMDNPWLENLVTGWREQTGQKIISKHESARAMVEVLRRNGILGLLADQDAKSDGVFVPFFGRPASTVKGPAVLALRYQVPIVPMEVWRDGDGVHRACIHDPIDPAEYGAGSGAVVALTTAFTARIEQFVRAHPEQWTWLHRRWKTRPPADAPQEPSHAGTMTRERA